MSSLEVMNSDKYVLEVVKPHGERAILKVLATSDPFAY